MEIDAPGSKNDGSNPSICEGEVSATEAEPKDSEVPRPRPSLSRKKGVEL